MQHSNVDLSRLPDVYVLVRWVADTLKLGRPCKRSSMTGREPAGGKEEEPGSSKVTVKCLCGCCPLVLPGYLEDFCASEHPGTMVQFPGHLAVFEFGPLKGMVTGLPEQYKVKMD